MHNIIRKKRVFSRLILKLTIKREHIAQQCDCSLFNFMEDCEAEYDAYRLCMGYTAEKMKNRIRLA